MANVEGEDKKTEYSFSKNPMMIDWVSSDEYDKTKIYDYLFAGILHESFLIVPYALKYTNVNHTTEVVKAFTTIMTAHDMAQRLIEWAIDEEVRVSEKDTIFRENTLCSVAIRHYLNLVGKDYLKESIGELVAEVIKAKIDLEIDPKIINDEGVRKKNLEKLLQYSNRFLDAFLQADKIPIPIRQLFLYITNAINKKFENNGSEIAKNAIVAFAFLRFACLSLISPIQFGINPSSTTEITSKANRNLVLIAKVIQAIANRQPNPEASYMSCTNAMVIENFSRFNAFIESLMIDKQEKREGEGEEEVRSEEKVQWKTAELAKLTKEAIQEQAWIIVQFLRSKEFDVEDMIRSLDFYLFKHMIAGQLPFPKLMEVLHIVKPWRWISTLEDLSSNMIVPSSAEKLQTFLSIPIDKDMPTYEGPRCVPSNYATARDWLESELKQHQFIILVFYRGAWCIFCKKYLRLWQEFAPRLRAIGGALFAISSDSKGNSEKFKNDLQLCYDVIGDPTNDLTDNFGMVITYSDMSKSIGFNEGMSQPGIVAINSKQEILYYWKSHPELRNLFGALARPKPIDIIKSIIDKIDVKLVGDNQGAAAAESSRKIRRADSEDDLAKMILDLDQSRRTELFKLLLNDDNNGLLLYPILKEKEKKLKAMMRGSKTTSSAETLKSSGKETADTSPKTSTKQENEDGKAGKRSPFGVFLKPTKKP